MGNRREGNKLIPTLSPFNGHRRRRCGEGDIEAEGKRGRREGRCQTTLKTAPGGESGGTKASSDYLGGYQRPKEDP